LLAVVLAVVLATLSFASIASAQGGRDRGPDAPESLRAPLTRETFLLRHARSLRQWR
jgi:hypothetical protein